MRYLFSVGLLLLWGFKSFSQEKHFILIQSENKQLFNASVNGKVYSTNASGYVIIPKLSDGAYTLVIAFPENSFPEQTFKCVIDKKDLGFALQNFGEKGWGLFNLQSLDMTMAGSSTAPVVNTETNLVKKEDEPIMFNRKGDTVATVVKLVERPVVLNQEVTGTPTTSEDSAKAIIEKVIDSIVRSEIKTAFNTDTQTVVTKLAEDKNSEGITLSYADANGSKTDTIQLTIPMATDTLVKNHTEAMSPEDSAVAARIALLNQRKDEVRFVEIDVNATVTDTTPKAEVKEMALPVVADTVKSTVITQPVTVAEPVAIPEKPVAKSGTEFCNNVATEEDYMRLRRKMALESTDEKMIREAKKIFKDKCFTTHQIKGLSSLFLSDEGRYRFFTASYSFVNDPAAYPALQSEFIDPFYINRFKAIVQ